MGYDCGFELHPRLTNSAADQELHARFVVELFRTYEDEDDRAMVSRQGPKGAYIVFEVGEHPWIPYNGEYFLPFSSKVSGGLTREAEAYIKRICRIARKYFGARVRFWHELNDDLGVHDYTDVRDAQREFVEVGPDGEGSK